jgi:transcriptional regulator with XRE-family HTH domain
MSATYKVLDWSFDMAYFADKVAWERKRCKLSQSQVAGMIGRSDSFVSQVERGEAEQTLQMRDFMALCNLFDLNPTSFYVLGGDHV